MSQHVIMIVGPMGSGKSSLVGDFPSHIHLNRDKFGGKIKDLLPRMEKALKNGDNVVLDNTYPTAEVRKPFIDLAEKFNVPISCLVMKTAIEDCQINILHRMWDEQGKIFFDKEDMRGIKNPHVFPIHVLFKYKKEYEKPIVSEGFESVDEIEFVRKPYNGKNKALIFDYDGTLREVPDGTDYKFPTDVSEVELLHSEKVYQKVQKVYPDYLLLGVSNQSGIAKGQVSETVAIECFEKTNELSGLDIKYSYCKHTIPPVSCYCRKPQSGFLVHLIRKYDLNPADCIFVGDQTSDRTFSMRLGLQYYDQKEFFGKLK